MIKNLFKSSLMILLLTLGLSGKSFAQELKFFTIVQEELLILIIQLVE